MINNNEIDELNKEISCLRRSLVLQIKTLTEMNKLASKMSTDIERVRELAKSWIDEGTKMLSIAPITDTHVERWTAVVVAGKDIIKALDGEPE